MAHRVWLFLASALIASGCTSIRYPVETLTDPDLIAQNPATAEHFRQVAELEQMLTTLGPGVDPLEAARVARFALRHPMTLAERYELTAPPLAHNVLVNLRLRPRGLCTHWCEDLLRELSAMDLQTLDLYWAVAYPPHPFRIEHSSPVVTARGAPFASGVLLDAWRHSGALHYVTVAEDVNFAWEPLPHALTALPYEE